MAPDSFIFRQLAQLLNTCKPFQSVEQSCIVQKKVGHLNKAEWSGPRLAALGYGYRWLMKSALLFIVLSVVIIIFAAHNGNHPIELGLPLLLVVLGLAIFVSAYFVFILLSSVAFIFWPSFLIVGLGLGVACRSALAKNGVKCGLMGPDKDLLADLGAQAQENEGPLSI